jgi:very-short-patch-repair endonuclease
MPTDAESKLWRALRPLREAGQPWRRQAAIGDYIVDFACLSYGLVVEVDGGQHAESRTDPERTAWLHSQGYRILRFWNHEVLQNAEGCVAIICDALNGGDGIADPLPDPPPQGGRE